MDIRKATSVQMVSPKWGYAIYETDWKGNPCEPTVHFLEKQTRKDGSIWYQQLGGWYASTLLERKPHCRDLDDENEVGLYIDFGQNWFVPAGPYSMAWDFIEAYMENPVERYFDSNVIETIAKDNEKWS